MDTKELIIQKALETFNEKGFEQTSARMIARELGISQGNLRYHFPNKEVIAEVLFNRFYEQFNSTFYKIVLPEKEITLINLIGVYTNIFDLYYDYWFILKDLLNISNKITSIKTKLSKDFDNRRSVILKVFKKLISNGYLRKIDDDYLYKKIIYLQIFIGDFWMPHSQIYFGSNLKNEIRHYHAHWITLLLPYLTKKGITELKVYLDKHPKSVPIDFMKFIKEY